MKTIHALGPYVQDLGLLGLDVEYHEDFRFDSRALWSLVQSCVHRKVSGKCVLDVGCNSGLFSLLLKRQGAGQVRALDVQNEYIDQANAIAKYLGEEEGLTFEVSSLFHRDKYTGPYDIVLALGLLYHLKDPFGAINRLAEISSDILLLETETNSPYLDQGESEFIQNRYRSDSTNWWLPGVNAIRDALNENGFPFVFAKPFREGVTGTQSYSLGFSEGMVQHGSRWFFAAYKNDPQEAPFNNVEATWQPRLFPVSENVERDDGQAVKSIRLRLKSDIQEEFLCRLEFYKQANSDQPIAIWQKTILSVKDAKILILNVSTQNLQSGIYIPVVSLFQQTNLTVPLDRLVFDAVEYSNTLDETSSGIDESARHWLQDGVSCMPATSKPVIDSIHILDENDSWVDSLMEAKPFQVTVALKNLVHGGLLRYEIVITDQDDHLITLLTSERLGLFDLDEDKQDIRLRFSNNHLATGSYRLQCILYGTGNSGPWQIKSEYACLYIVGEGTCEEVLLPFWELTGVEPAIQETEHSTDSMPGIIFKEYSADASPPQQEFFTGKSAGQNLSVAPSQGQSQALILYELFTSAKNPRRVCVQNIPVSFGEDSESSSGFWRIHLFSKYLPLGAGSYQEKYSLVDAHTLHTTEASAFREFQVHDTGVEPIGIFSPHVKHDKDKRTFAQSQLARQSSVDIGNVSLLDVGDKPVGSVQSGDCVKLRIELFLHNPQIRPELEIEFTDEQYANVMTCRSSEDGVTIQGDGPSTIQLIIRRLPLLPGKYFLRVKAWDHGISDALQPPEVQSLGDHFHFEVTGEMQTERSGLCLFVENRWEDF